MKKIALGVALVAALAGGQYYSGHVVAANLDKVNEEVEQQGFSVRDQTFERGVFRSHVHQVIEQSFDGTPIQIELDWTLHQWPWGVSFDGDVEVTAPDEQGQVQKFIADVLNTRASMSGGYNLFGGGHGEFILDAFDVIVEDGQSRLIAAEPIRFEARTGWTGHDLTYDAHLPTFTVRSPVDDDDNDMIDFQANTPHEKTKLLLVGMRVSGEREGLWPRDERILSKATIAVDQLLLQNHDEDSYELKKLNAMAAVAVEHGTLSYEVNLDLGELAAEQGGEPFSGSGHGEFVLAGLHVGSFKDLLLQYQQAYAEGIRAHQNSQQAVMGAVDTLMHEQQDALIEASKASLKASELTLALNAVDIKTSRDDLAHITGDAHLAFDTKRIDPDELISALQARSRSPLQVIVKDITSGEAKMTGLPKSIMGSLHADDDTLNAHLEKGVLTVNGHKLAL